MMLTDLPGPFSDFESPPKGTTSLPSSFPSLRAPANQTTLFSSFQPRSASPDKPLPAPPPPNQDYDRLFRTPRKPSADFVSSGGETPDTIDDSNAADTEATPEMLGQRLLKRRNSPTKGLSKKNGEPVTFKAGGPAEETDGRTRSPKKKRESLFSRLWNSPSRMEALKGYSTKAESRVVKRRSRQTGTRSVARRTTSKSERYYSDSDSDYTGAKSRRRHKKEDYDTSTPGGKLTYYVKLIHDHPDLPRILIDYLQLFCNFVVGAVIFFVLYWLWSMVKGEVEDEIAEEMAKALIQVRNCQLDYDQANCASGNPRFRDVCEGLEQCKNRNPERVGKASMIALTLGKVVTKFTEPFTWKATVRTLLHCITH
jgi:hypothetical protein